MKQLINQQICPILGVRVYTPLVNDIEVIAYCMNMNGLMMLRAYSGSGKGKSVPKSEPKVWSRVVNVQDGSQVFVSC